jgi:hypothetical protein
MQKKLENYGSYALDLQISSRYHGTGSFPAHPYLGSRRIVEMKQPLIKLATVLGLLVVLVSCYSLIESAVENAVAAETEEAVTGSEGDSEQAQAEGGGSTSGTGAAGAAGAHNIVGTWINPEYNDEGRSARVVYSLNADGTYTYLAFDRIEGGDVYEGTVKYLKTWVDEEGRSCGQSVVTLGGMSWDTLDRISVDESILEVQSGVRKIDPKGPRYSIYYRQ